MAQASVFYQLFERESSTYTYLIADPVSQECALIDSVLESVDRDLKLVDDLGLKLKYVLDTHIHADHITGAGELRRRTGAKSAVSSGANVNCIDICLNDGDELLLGDRQIKAIATPGHTNSCMSFLFDGRVFTGDALLIRGCGRTDFQGGSSETLYQSVHNKLFSLPPDTQVYPGHDYTGQTASTIALETHLNPRLGMSRSKAEFIKTMSELKLADPKRLHEALPANLACGKVAPKKSLSPQIRDGLPEVTPEEVHATLGKVRLIDVRRPEEFDGGHISGAERKTLGPELTEFLNAGDRTQEMVFICRSGGRSSKATSESLKLGYDGAANMTGGMLRWLEIQFPTQQT